MDLEPKHSAIIEKVHECFRGGDYLKAFEACSHAIEENIKDIELVYLAILSLARCGATNEAVKTFHKLREYLPDTEDVMALEARLAKDQFNRATDPAQKILFCKRARDQYYAAFQRTKGSFSAINAATLSLFLGEKEVSEQIAKEVLQLCEKTPKPDYWTHVTTAEACLLLGRSQDAPLHLKKARDLKPHDFGSQATTYRQLRLIVEHQKLDQKLIQNIRPPSVIHYTGHMIHGIGSTPGIRENEEVKLRAEVSKILEDEGVEMAYGSLACGADLIIAEEVIRRGGLLYVVLPFGINEFLEMSVRPGGKIWEERFHAVLSKASSIDKLVEEGYCDFELLFETASFQAMGSAILKSLMLGSDVFQLALWNNLPSKGSCGTGADITTWKSLGRDTRVIPVSVPPPVATPVAVPPPETDSSMKRAVRAMIFADLHGFSKLKESEVKLFLTHWFEKLSSILAAYADQVVFANTWGDAIFLVVDNIPTAAEISLKLVAAMSMEAWEKVGLSSVRGVRVSAHAGPVFVMPDPVLNKTNFFGMHVTKAARMEPCTPVGTVFVTEEFAAQLAIQAGKEYLCEYVGEQPLPKNFGSFRMYHLSKRI